MGQSKSVALYVAVAVLAVGAALLTLLVAPPENAPVAAVTVMLSSISLALGIRQIAIDRGSLRVEVSLERYGVTDVHIVVVRVYNGGRRPVRVEKLGFAAEKTKAVAFPGWMKPGPLASASVEVTLGEGESKKVVAYPQLVAKWYVRYEAPKWLFATGLDGGAMWWRLPADVCAALAEEWPAAREAYRRDQEAEAAKPEELDDWGHPLRNIDVAG